MRRLRLRRRSRRRVLRRRLPRHLNLAAMDDPGEDDAQPENAARDQQKLVQPDDRDQAGGRHRAEERAQVRPEHDQREQEHDQREQALARILRVEVVRETPELGDHHDVEDPDPDVERDPQDRGVQTQHGQEVEGTQMGDEEQGDPGDQLLPRSPGCQRAERTDHEDEQDCLRPGKVALELRPLAVQDERLPHRLDDRVGGQDQEDVQGQEENREDLAAMDHGEDTKEPMDDSLSTALLCVAVRHGEMASLFSWFFDCSQPDRRASRGGLISSPCPRGRAPSGKGGSETTCR